MFKNQYHLLSRFITSRNRRVPLDIEESDRDSDQDGDGYESSDAVSMIPTIESASHERVATLTFTPSGYELTERRHYGYYLAVMALVIGSERPFRRGLPREVVTRICYLANYCLPDRNLSCESKDPTTVMSYGPKTTSTWFRTLPLENISDGHVIGLQLSTFSHDQGWADDPMTLPCTWFELEVVDESTPPHDMAMGLDNEGWISHRNKPKTPQYDQYEGIFFDIDHDIWSRVSEGDSIAVTINATYGSWTNYAGKGRLLVYTRWSPSNQMMDLIYGRVQSTSWADVAGTLAREMAVLVGHQKDLVKNKWNKLPKPPGPSKLRAVLPGARNLRFVSNHGATSSAENPIIDD